MLRSTLLLFGSAVALPVLFAAACVSGTQIIDGGSVASSGAGGAGTEDDGTICVLHNCKSDSDCGACSERRKLCNLRDHRCVTCDIATGIGCDESEFCSDFGSCVPKGLSCDMDDHGVPTIQCATNIDCAACDPAHQVCDEGTGSCVACTALNTSNCGKGESCTGQNTCSAECPSECATDNECAPCGAGAGTAFSCITNKCVPMSGSDGGTTDDGGATSPDGGSTGGSCHDACTVGGKMLPTCNTCIKAVCDKDAFCCDTAWDSVCVSEVGDFCNKPCTIPPSTCAHNECVIGKVLDPECSACAGEVCQNDSFCCTVAWDATCVENVELYCGIKCQ